MIDKLIEQQETIKGMQENEDSAIKIMKIYEDYKLRVDKAVEYIRHEWFKREQIGIAPLDFSYEELQNLLDILEGSDKE